MASLNKVQIIGNLGKDPEVRYTPSGAAVCNVSIATKHSWKDKDSGDKKEETEWHSVVFYGKTAELVGQYLSKGNVAYVEGRLKTRKWQDKDGNDRYTTEIIADSVQFFGQREGGQERQEPAPRAPEKPAPRSAPPRPAPKTGTGFDDMDGDVPF